MERQRVVAIGLDGMELTLAERLMAEGRMPNLKALRDRSAWYRLDYGPAQRTGLAWEHVASGKSPDAGGRWAAVEFDPGSYDTWQEGARFAPWWAAMDRRIVVFDPPYVDLERAQNTRGIVGWGAHDPGTSATGRPDDLLSDFREQIGAYPAAAHTYTLPWPSPARTATAGAELAGALRVRTNAARWLAAERMTDWDLFFVVEGELHGATEGLWHGIDPDHPLHGHPSAAAAGDAMVGLYGALDEMVGSLAEVAGDAAVVAFTLGGMGSNHSDVASMVLLPELLYRQAFGRPLLTVPAAWSANPASVSDMAEDAVWAREARSWYPAAPSPAPKRPPASPLRKLARRVARPVRWVLRGGRPKVAPATAAAGATGGSTATGRPPGKGVSWQPAFRYHEHWPSMPAFAIPSYYDGRIRLNLRGRERDGTVEPAAYEATLAELEATLRECRNPMTGEPAVAFFERASTSDPLAMSGSEVDLLVIWNGVVGALEHPTLGLVGPVPLRRTGGHTGEHGVAFIAAPGVEPGERGVRSAFDVVPTIAKLMDAPIPAGTSGTPLL